MIALIVNFNRLTLPKTMAEWLAARNVEPVFVDNHSDYPPLLEYYEKCGFRVIRQPENYGHTVVWLNGIVDQLGITGRYIMTDPDLDLSGVPDDFIAYLNRGLDLFPGIDKCALSLEINDLPDTTEGIAVRTKYEARYWQRPTGNGYWFADTDTTLAMYRETARNYNHCAIRADRPYTARHVPWYYRDFESLPDDEKYYFQTANDSSSGKKRLFESIRSL